MPAKNAIKQYLENGYYHIYNRGVEKHPIYLDNQDYQVFLKQLQRYLDPTIEKPHSLASEIYLLAFVLMPNHFHLLVKQTQRDSITKLLRAICSNYVSYFNKKYHRVGPLFQGRFKGILILEENYFLHLSRYIHLNPGSDPIFYPYSSYCYYINKTPPAWIRPDDILAYFKTARRISLKDTPTYQIFVESYTLDSEVLLGNLTLEIEGSDPN